MPSRPPTLRPGARRPSPAASALKAAAAGAALAATLILAACGTTTAPANGRLQVVAAENFWGSLAAQLGGSHAQVRSVIVNPDTDPHSYEPTAADARTMAAAQMAIVNGIGYDAWADHLLSANPQPGRVTLDVGHLTNLPGGANPHQWYSPAVVDRVIGAITADYIRLDPRHAADYRRLNATVSQGALKSYRALLARIAARYSGTPIGASESIFAPMAAALRLHLLTPTHFMDAVAEGTDPSAADKATADRQIAQRTIAVWVLNRQNVTPDVQRLTAAAQQARIPVVTVTETLSPASATFEAWQADELRRLAAALASATHR